MKTNFYDSILSFLRKPFFRLSATVFSHGATHFLFLILVAIIVGYLWFLNNQENIVPHNLGLHIGWTSVESAELKNMNPHYRPKDSINNVKIQIALNSNIIKSETNGEYSNGIFVEFDAKARAVDVIDNKSNELISTFNDSYIC